VTSTFAAHNVSRALFDVLRARMSVPTELQAVNAFGTAVAARDQRSRA